MSLLFLTGFMGTGKSTVGPLVARALGYTFVDLDREIAHDSGMSIPRIFDTEGEAGFRKRETAALTAQMTRDNLVVATGGGIVLGEENRRLMLKAGHVVCLTADPNTVIARAGKHPSERPVLENRKGADLLTHVTRLLALRAPFYGECHHQVDTTGRPAPQVAEEILRLHREGAWKR